MEQLTTEQLAQYCRDTEELTSILLMLIECNAVTPKIISSVGKCAAKAEKFLEAYQKML